MRDVVSQSPAYTNATRPQREVEKRYSGESKFTQSVFVALTVIFSLFQLNLIQHSY